MITTLIASLGLKNPDGTPVDPEQLVAQMRLNQQGQPAVEGGETFRGVTPEGGPPQGPTSEEARTRWQLLGADADGRIYDADRNHILDIDAEGGVTDLRGRPVQKVDIQDTPGAYAISSYVDADGKNIKPSFGGTLQRMEQTPDGKGVTLPPHRSAGTLPRIYI